VQAVFPERDLPVLVSLEITAGSTFGVVNVETDVPTKAVVRYSAGTSPLIEPRRTRTTSRGPIPFRWSPFPRRPPTTFQVEWRDETGATVSSPIRTFTTPS